jgi:hypothetical protein
MYHFCMYVSYVQALCTLCSVLEPGGCGLITLHLDAVHAQSASQPPFELVYSLPLPLLRPHNTVYAFSYAVCALTLPH